MQDFVYLKNWINFQEPRPIILECEPSKSGMSLSIWDRDRKIFTIGGCGFDRVGCAIATVLTHCWQTELDTSDATSLYGARRKDDGRVSLDGACGAGCMQAIGKMIGLNIHTYDSHHGVIIHIAKA